MADSDGDEGRSVRSLTDQERMKCFDMIKDAVGDGFSDRAAVFSVSVDQGLRRSSLQKMWDRMKSNGGQIHATRVFSPEQEAIIAGMFTAFSLCNRGLVRATAAAMVREMAGGREDFAAEKWVDNFLERNKDLLRKQKAKGMPGKRVDKEVLDDVEEFINWYEEWVKENRLTPDAMVNADETRITVTQRQRNIPTIESTLKPKPGITELVAAKGATYIPFVTAVGEMVMSVFIVPIDNDGSVTFPLKRVQRGRRDQHNTYYTYTDSGWLNEKTWVLVLQKLDKEWRRRFPKRKLCLHLDNLRVHMTVDSLRLCTKKAMLVVFFPKNATHFIQPADDVMFATFKRKLQETHSESLTFLTSDDKDLGKHLLGLAQDLEVVITPEVIKASWRNTGMYPFDKELIVKNAKANVADVATEMDTETTTQALLSDAVSLVTETIQQNLPGRKRKHIRAKTLEHRLYLGSEILEVSEKERAEKERAAEERKKKKEEKDEAKGRKKREWEERYGANFCRGRHHSKNGPPEWKGDEEWMWCESCETFGMCKKCMEKHENIMIKHENSCGVSEEESDE